jgi:hypothetical protein
MNAYSFCRSATLVSTLALGCLAHAVTMSGSIIFYGTAVLNNPAPQLATAVTSWTNPIIVGGSTIPGTGATATFVAPWQFNLGAPIPNFWSSGTTSFTLNASSITSQGIDGLGQGYVVVGGSGTLTSPGFDPTFATFNFSSQDPDLTTGGGAQTGLFSISASGLAFPNGNPGPGTGVPDGGTTVGLLAVALLTTNFLGRRFRFVAR